MSVPRLLVVEDDLALQRVIQAQIAQMGVQVSVAGEVPEALEILRKDLHDLVISDLNLPGLSGLELLKTVRAEYPDTTVILMTAFGTVETAVEAMKNGAYDYLTKPLHPYELRLLVNRVLERRRLLEEVRSLRETIDNKFGFDSMLGHSKALLRVLDSAAYVAGTDATVLILGETGTGKELLAKAIHVNSARRDRPFVVINCGAIPRELLESELFGHVRGAFTGALTHKKGKVEMADGGTVFLDEIGEMPLELQVRLLRLVQEREIEKVGSAHQIKVDVRIIAATNRNLEQLIKEGRFREDLYYRLAVVPLTLPALRERMEDISELVVHFFERSKERLGKSHLKLPSSMLSYFQNHDWPGNVRELENTLSRIVVLCRGDQVMPSDLPVFLHGASSYLEPEKLILPENGLSLEALERSVILAALRRFNGNQTNAARHLSISRKVLMNRMAKYRIRKSEVQALTSDLSPQSLPITAEEGGLSSPPHKSVRKQASSS
ncbi:MAG TPA: sigma-54 dependent transcriptional regulator [Bryobacteraceae bacterium]